MIDKKSKLIVIRPRTWIDDLMERFPHLFHYVGEYGFTVGEGWKELLTSLCERLDELGLPDLRVRQVKEKFGTLRFYVAGGNDAVSDLIRQAEIESSTTCEWCGGPGRYFSDRWMRTLCDACNAKYLGNR